MQINNIVANINALLAGEMLPYTELRPFLDRTITDINSALNSKYPTFSELSEFNIDYNMFPNKYITSVVVPGAAWYYYIADEEGMPTAQQYNMDYRNGLFLMQRDMLYGVPLEYQADDLQGTVQFEFTAEQGIQFDNTVGEW